MCPIDIKMQAYKGLIRPTPGYASAVGNPHQTFIQTLVRACTKQTSRFTTETYLYEPGSMTKILRQLNVPSLNSRRKQSRLILMYKALANRAAIDSSELFTPERSFRRSYIHCFRQLRCRTEVHNQVSSSYHSGLERSNGSSL